MDTEGKGNEGIFYSSGTGADKYMKGERSFTKYHCDFPAVFPFLQNSGFTASQVILRGWA